MQLPTALIGTAATTEALPNSSEQAIENAFVEHESFQKTAFCNSTIISFLRLKTSKGGLYPKR